MVFGNVKTHHRSFLVQVSISLSHQPGSEKAFGPVETEVAAAAAATLLLAAGKGSRSVFECFVSPLEKGSLVAETVALGKDSSPAFAAAAVVVALFLYPDRRRGCWFVGAVECSCPKFQRDCWTVAATVADRAH